MTISLWCFIVLFYVCVGLKRILILNQMKNQYLPNSSRTSSPQNLPYMKKLLLLATLLASSISYTQEKIEYIDYEEIFAKIADLTEKEEFSEIVSQLNKINKNDSIYETSLVLKSYYLLQNEEYDEALKVIEEGVTNKNFGSRYSFFVNKGVAYLRSERYQQAINVYDEAIKEFPKNHILFYNRGLAYEGLEKNDKAVLDYKQSILLNPFYAKSHLQLGKICYREHKISQALMAINMYLLLDPDGENSLSILSSINNSVSKKNESTPLGITISKDDESFEDIDLIISNGIALNNKYEIKNKIKIPLTKQNHALLEQLKDFEGSGGFWDQKYVPFYQWIFNNEYFDDFTYTISYTIQNKNFKKIIEKNTSKITAFIDLFYAKWMEIIDENEQIYQGEKQVVTHFFSDYTLQAVGVTKDDKMVGTWETYNEQGRINGKGKFNKKGDKTGVWVWYDDHGNVSEKETYKDGKLNGEYTSFYKSGVVKTTLNYKDGKPEGVYNEFNKKSALIEKKVFANNKLQGEYQSYHGLGVSAKDYTASYTDAKLVGLLTRHYANGKLFYEVVYKDGVITGIENSYYINDQLKSAHTYANGILNGPYKKYYSNGNLWEEGITLNGDYHGNWKIYYPDGVIKKEMIYEKGKLNGVYKEFDTDGKLHEEFLYRKNEILAYTYYNKAGEVIKEAKKKKGAFYYQGYSALGVITAEGLYDVKGGKKGTWKYYDDGVLINTGTYIDDKLEGNYYGFYKTGEKESVTEYKNDTITGFYEGYYKNGNMSQQGWYKEGKAHGLWINYYSDGSVKEKNFYHRGAQHGVQETYSVEGKLYQTILYNLGDIVSGKYFNPDGSIQEEIQYDRVEESYVITYNHLNDKLHSETSFVYGVKHGDYKRYYENGNKAAEGSYFNNQQHGIWTWYYENGQISHQGEYSYGELHGDYNQYYKNGQLDNKSIYQHGKLEGIYEGYSEDGVLIRTTQYKNGNRQGERTFYSPDGKLQIVRYYHNDKMIGYSYHDEHKQLKPMIPIKNQTAKIKAYFDNGIVSVTMEVKNGNFINAYKTYYYSGQISRDIHYKDGDYHGSTIYYNADGKIKKDIQYKHDQLNGVYKKYYTNGNLQQEVNYKNDMRSGEAKYYNIEGELIKTRLYYNDMVAEEKIY